MAGDSGHVDDQLQALRGQIAAMADQMTEMAEALAATDRHNARLRTDLARLRATMDAGGDAMSADLGTERDRRAFLRGGALAAGAVASGIAASVVGAAPAVAADGDPLVIGDTTGNTASAPTALTVDLQTTGPTPWGVAVSDNLNTDLQLFGPSALVGHADGGSLSVGVHGVSTGSTVGVAGAGVVGIAGGAIGATGVVGVGETSGVFGLGAVGVRGKGVAEVGIGVEAEGDLATMLLKGPDHFPPGRALLTAPASCTPRSPRTATGPPSGSAWRAARPAPGGAWPGPGPAGPSRCSASRCGSTTAAPANPPLVGDKTKLTGSTSPRVIGTAGHDVFPPTGMAGLLVNLTVVNTSAGGFVALHRGDVPWPGSSTINWTAADTVIANSAVVALAADGPFAATCAAGASTDLIVDVVGYLL